MIRAVAAIVFMQLPQAEGVGSLYRPGEERVWVFEQDGKRIGFSTFRYEGKVDLLGASAHRFTSRVELDAMPAIGLPEPRYG